MPSLTSSQDADDDFILTISDNDLDGATRDTENSSLIEESGRKRRTSKKRKRAEEQHTRNGLVKPGKKRVKLNGIAQESGVPNVIDEDREESDDDLGMDSEFEFQIGDMDRGVVDGFDGWDLDERISTGPEKKSGVDIDELIARRRRKNGDEDKAISEGDEDAQENGRLVADMVMEEEDETLAEDGFGMGVGSNDEDDAGADMEDDQQHDTESDDGSVAQPVPHPDDEEDSSHSESDEEDGAEESARREAFFAPEDQIDRSARLTTLSNSFQDMSLSRPILRGLASVGFSEPTPIQKKTIPAALLGKDVVGGAVTGSGKTAAFMIPILERLLYRPRRIPTSRVAILMPTRELAVQCYNVAKKLASFTDVTFCQLVGGFSLREQETVLRSRPDVIIATPGRFIDHMRNSASFTVDTLEILVLDEADRMLEDGFADELNEILSTIPKSRQTMLFSATMTDEVDKLIRVGLNRPVRLLVDAKKQTVGTLLQEFVRLRPGREEKRLGYLLYLCENIYTDRVIIFFRQKKEAHRVRIIFGLCGLKATELHGNMTQEQVRVPPSLVFPPLPFPPPFFAFLPSYPFKSPAKTFRQRLSALTSFRTSRATHLLATDVASRGLDIPSVTCVLNYSAPQSSTIYLHRVGRTARAGRAGRACTLAAESDRKVVKEVVRAARNQGAHIVSRVVDAHLADACMDRVDGLAEEVEAILTMEKEERALGEAERDVRKGENLVDFEAEIKSRPKRTWFATEREKDMAKERGRKELNGPADATAHHQPPSKQAPSKKGSKLSNKQRKALDAKKEMRDGRAWKKGKGDSKAVGTGKGTTKVKVKVKARDRVTGKPKANLKMKVKEGRGGNRKSIGSSGAVRGRRK